VVSEIIYTFASDLETTSLTIKNRLRIMSENLSKAYMKVGNYAIEDISMLDKDTCCMCFYAESDDNGSSQIEVEYWLDDNSWHFLVNYYDEVGDYVDNTICSVFNDREVEKCKDIINEFLSSIALSN